MKSAPRSGECPEKHSSASLVTHGFADVASTFAGFTAPQEFRTHRPRGGVVRADKRPRYEEPLAPGYGVESTFTDEQRRYVSITVAGLNKLLRGEVFAPRTSNLPPLHSRIVTHMLEQRPEEASFGNAVGRGIIGIFRDFGSNYPNLTPALEATTRTGGMEGVTIAAALSRPFLENAIAGEPVTAEVAHLKPGASRRRFTDQHPDQDAQNWHHEVWCPGEAVAKSLIRQAGQAAVTLAAIPEIRDSYLPVNDKSYENRIDLRTELELLIPDMVASAD